MHELADRRPSIGIHNNATYVDTPFVQVSFEQSERVIGAVICQASFCNFHMLRAGMD